MESFDKLLNVILKKENFFKFIILLFMSFLLMFLEIISLVSLASLGSILTDNEILLNSIFKLNYNFSFSNILFCIILFFSLKNVFLVIYNFLQAKFAGRLFFLQSKDLFLNFSSRSYLTKIQSKPEELIRKISSDSISAVDYLFVIFNLIKEFIILIGIVVLLFISNNQPVLIIFIIFSIIGLIFFKVFKNFLKKISNKFIKGQTKIIAILNQTFGSLKENFIYKNNTYLEKKFDKLLYDVRDFYFYRSFIISLPRITFEITALIAIIITTLIMFSSGSVEKDLINKISLLAVISIRLIPSFNTITTNLSMIKIYQNFFNIIQEDLQKRKLVKVDKKKASPNETRTTLINFDKKLEFSNVNFAYPGSKNNLFDKAKIVITKNNLIGIYGTSGSGKTTLIDYIIGLLDISKNKININGKKIQDKFEFEENLIGYVPQNPFLLNDTIKNNIIFNRKKKIINNTQLVKAMKLARIDHFVNKLTKKENTIIGHDGVFLSGGQKQRIIIARAILFQPKLLILDEATNALDKYTENEIIHDISKIKKNMSIILITHDKELINKCDVVFKIKNKKILIN
jgi:ATP-binding cassette, subfamily B, bacterial PglK